MRTPCFIAGLAILFSASGCASLIPKGQSLEAPQELTAETEPSPLQPSQEAIDFERIRRAGSMNAVVLQIDGKTIDPRL